jgi:primosomal protein N''
MSVSNHPVEQEELMAYLDGELSPDRTATAAGHLEECPQCRQLVAELEEVSEMLGAWQVEEAEREPAKTVSDRFAKRGSTELRSPAIGWRELMDPRRWPKPIWGLAAITVIVGLVLTTPWMRSRFVYEPEALTRESAKPIPDQVRAGQRVPRKSKAQSEPTEDISTDGNLLVNGAPQPSATPTAGGGGGGALGKLQRDDDLYQARAQLNDVTGVEQEQTSTGPTANGPMIIRTAELQVTTDDFGKARDGVEEILKRHRGYIGELNVNTPAGSARSLTGTLRVPANQLEATLSDLKGLGHTEKESQGGEEVTEQYVDLQARLANAKHTEQRLTDMLRDRTGKLSDVLYVELQISRVRGEIEHMEAQRKTMKNQVDLATITITLAEAYKAELKAVPPSTGTQFRNAAVEGYKSLVGTIIALLLWLLSVGPTLVLWAAILFFPVRMAWKRLRSRLAASKESK